MAIITGILTSEWDGRAARFDTKATLNQETGEVQSLEMIEGNVLEGLSCLTDEYFTDSEGTTYPVCENCHGYITKTVMVDDNTGCGIHEEQECMGHCEE